MSTSRVHRFQRPSGRILERFFSHREALPLTLLIIVVVAFWIANPVFLSAQNVSGMFAFIPELGLIALGMTLLLTAGQFDLSVGAVFGFVPLLVFLLANDHGVPFTVAVIIGLLVGALIGLGNGFFVTKLGISSFLVTLSTQLIVHGTALYISQGFPQSTLDTDSRLTTLLDGTFQIGGLELYAGLVWFIVIAILLSYLLNQTRFGNWTMATGGNPEAAQARGIRTGRVTTLLFVLTALLASLAGIISDVRVGSAYPTAGEGYELEVIAMAVVGGTSLLGGSGTIIGTVIGVILLRAIRNGVILVGVPGLAFSIFVGAIILITLSLQVGLSKIHRVGGFRGVKHP